MTTYELLEIIDRIDDVEQLTDVVSYAQSRLENIKKEGS